MSALGRWWLCLGVPGILLQFEVPLAIACLLVLLLGALMGTLAGCCAACLTCQVLLPRWVYGAPCAEWGYL